MMLVRRFGLVILVALSIACEKSNSKDRIMIKRTESTWTNDALDRGDIDAVMQKAINDPGYLSERDYVGDTPLLTVIAYGNVDLARFLIQHGADPNVEVDDGYTSLLTAIESEEDVSNEITELLIRSGADIHATGINGWTPLHMASIRGYKRKAELLIAAGAEINRRVEIDSHETPLMLAAAHGHADLVSLLLKHGADPMLRDLVFNHTPLDKAKEALKGPNPDLIEMLKSEDMKPDYDELLNDSGFSADEIKSMKEIMKAHDPVRDYIETCNEILKEGDHHEVVRILQNHSK